MQSISNWLSPDSAALKIAIVAAVVVAAALILAVIYRLVFGHRLRVPGASRARQPRLGLVDAFSLDGQRQLVLVRRDNVEHLIMIGGPNDVLLEIADRARRRRRSRASRASSRRSPSSNRRMGRPMARRLASKRRSCAGSSLLRRALSPARRRRPFASRRRPFASRRRASSRPWPGSSRRRPFASRRRASSRPWPGSSRRRPARSQRPRPCAAARPDADARRPSAAAPLFRRARPRRSGEACRRRSARRRPSAAARPRCRRRTRDRAAVAPPAARRAAFGRSRGVRQAEGRRPVRRSGIAGSGNGAPARARRLSALIRRDRFARAARGVPAPRPTASRSAARRGA